LQSSTRKRLQFERSDSMKHQTQSQNLSCYMDFIRAHEHKHHNTTPQHNTKPHKKTFENKNNLG
jgi:hypothetical protein